MKNALLIVLALAAGAAGGLAAVLVLPSPEMPRESEAPNALLSRVEDAEERLARMEDALRRVEAAQEVARAAASPPSSPAADPPASSPGEVSSSATAADPALDDRIREVIEERDRVQREEARKRMEEGMQQRQAELLDALEKELGLNAYQREEVARILAERHEAMQAVRARYFPAGGPPPAESRDLVREEMRKVWEATDQKLQTVLTPDQFRTMKEKELDRGAGPGGFGGGPGGPGGPGR